MGKTKASWAPRSVRLLGGGREAALEGKGHMGSQPGSGQAPGPLTSRDQSHPAPSRAWAEERLLAVTAC